MFVSLSFLAARCSLLATSWDRLAVQNDSGHIRCRNER